MNKKTMLVVIGLILLLSTVNMSSMFGDAAGVDGGSDEEVNIVTGGLEEECENTPEPNWFKVFGPYTYLWVEADLSKEEFVWFVNTDDTYPKWTKIFIEFLPEDVNDKSYIKWGPGFIEKYWSFWDHNWVGDDHLWFGIEIDNPKIRNIKYSNGRVQIKLSGWRGIIAIMHSVHPMYDDSMPRDPAIIGPIYGKTGVECEYTFFSRDYGNAALRYYIDWGDGNIEDWIGPYESLEAFTLTHSWESTGTYYVSVKARNTTSPMSNPSDTTTIKVTVSNKINIDIDGAMNNINMPINQQYNSQSQSTPSNQQYESQGQSIPLSNPLVWDGLSNNNQ